MSCIGRKIDELPSPAFIVDLSTVRRNCERMKQRCEALGVQLRPHMKTHKTLYVRVQLCCICSTVSG